MSHLEQEAQPVDCQDSDRLRASVDSEVVEIELNRIELSGGTQSRAGFDESTINDYIESWERGIKFPAIELYFDGQKYWLADGFHRVVSRQRAKIQGSTIAAIIHQGTRRDAVLASVGANACHGLRRTHADKRRAVEILLRDREWGKWSDREIARRCGVGNKFVGDLRRSLCSEHSEDSTMNEEQSERTFTTKHGTTATMRTGSIGKKAEPKTSKENLVPSTVEEKLQRQAKELGLGGRGKEQLLPSVDRNHTSPVDVDDRPFATSKPPLVTTTAAASSWDEGAQLQTASPHLMKTSDSSANDALAPSVEEYQQTLEEAKALKAERNELKQKLAEANTMIECLRQEVQELQGQLRMSA